MSSKRLHPNLDKEFAKEHGLDIEQLRSEARAAASRPRTVEKAAEQGQYTFMFDFE